MNKTENKKKEDILIKAKKVVSIEGWSSEIFSKLQKQNIKDYIYFLNLKLHFNLMNNPLLSRYEDNLQFLHQ